MLTRVRASKNIAIIQRRFQARLEGLLPARAGPYIIGFQGGNVTVDSIAADGRIWYHAGNAENAPVPRFLNTFGIAERLRRYTSNDICVEINVPSRGAPKSVAGFFARDSVTGSIYLMHSGKVGGGKKGIGKGAFLEWSQFPLVNVTSSQKTPSTEQAIIVGELGSDSLIDTVAEFVRTVHEFKESVVNREVAGLSNPALAALARKGNKRPQKKIVESMVYERNRYVAEYAKRRASGKCDLCKAAAPFTDRLGSPFLESHHIIWLSTGGPDTIENSVALCPNCHRKVHVVPSEADVQLLKKKASAVI